MPEKREGTIGNFNDNDKCDHPATRAPEGDPTDNAALEENLRQHPSQQNPAQLAEKNMTGNNTTLEPNATDGDHHQFEFRKSTKR